MPGKINNELSKGKESLVCKYLPISIVNTPTVANGLHMTLLKVELGRVSSHELQHTDNTHQQNDNLKSFTESKINVCNSSLVS